MGRGLEGHSATQSACRDVQIPTTYFKDMLSTPIARPSFVSPLCMLCAMLRIAINPDEHKRFTVEIGTEAGIPAASAAARET